MNRRTFAALFCILFAVPFFSGCGVDENSEILISESVETTKRTQITEITKITNVTGTQTAATTAPVKEKNIFDAIKRLCFNGQKAASVGIEQIFFYFYVNCY
jgi:hypothetical protein